MEEEVHKRKKIKTSGGHGLPAHSDAVRARTIGQRGRASGVKSLSNEELADYAKRLNLEQNVKRLQYNDASPPKKFVLTLVGKTGQQQAHEVANQQASKAVAKLMAKADIKTGVGLKCAIGALDDVGTAIESGTSRLNASVKATAELTAALGLD